MQLECKNCQHPKNKDNREMSVSKLTNIDWVYALLCSVTMGFGYSIITVGTPIFPQYFRSAHIYNEEIVEVTVGNKTTREVIYENEAVYNGIMFASFEITQIIMQPVYGHLMKNKIRPRFVIMFVMPLFVLTTLLFALCDSYEALLASRSLQGFVGAGINSCAYTILTDRFLGSSRMTVLPMVSISFVLFSRFVPALGGTLYDSYGKTTAFMALTWMAAIIYFAWLGLSAFEMVKRYKIKAKMMKIVYYLVLKYPLNTARPLSKNQPVSYRVLLTNVTPVVIYLATMLTFVPYAMMAPLLSNRLHELDGAITQQCVFLISCKIGMLIVYSLPGVFAGWLIIHNVAKRSWYSHAYPIVACMLIHALASAVAAIGKSYWHMWFALSLMSCVNFTLHATCGGMICDYVNKRCSSRNTVKATSLLFLFVNAGAIVGLVGGGFAVQTLGYSIAWKCLSIGYVIVTVAMMFWLRYERKQEIRL